MNIDYSYLDTFLRIFDEKGDIDELKDNVGFKTVITHSQRVGNDFNLRNIEDAIKGKSDRGYGLRNLLTNVERIKKLYNTLKLEEREWLGEVKANAEKLFGDIDHQATTIYPIIGYDIGIGLNGIVCVNLNSEICLKDYRELISIIIHEITHIYYDSIHGSILDYLKVDTLTDMKNILNRSIQYEGAGIFSAEEYRINNKLPNTGSPIQEDYEILIDKDKGLELFREYKELLDDLMSGKVKDKEEFMERGFGQSKMTHRLGYSVFTKINENRGIKGVREAINMSNKDFVEEFLI